MKIKSYIEINKSTKAPAHTYLINLKKEYGTPTELELTNKQNVNFVIFKDALIKQLKEFEDSSIEAISRRGTTIDEYLSSKYIASEINSSLRVEGVHSSRKIVDAVLKAKKEGKQLSNNDITKLICNYYDALNFILSKKKINARNLNTLYSIVSADLPNIVEDGSLYREGEVSIGCDEGVPSKLVKLKINELLSFIESDSLKDIIQVKAIVSHYIFENIHPYYEYNGRLGRLLHLWILINDSREEFWKMTYLSEAIFSFKTRFDKVFDNILKAKKSKANIDLTYFVSSLLNIFNLHTKAYILMKDLTNKAIKSPSKHLRTFIVDMLCEHGNVGKWYEIKDFKKKYSDYSKTVYDRLLSEIKNSGIFEIRSGKPIQFRLIKN